MHGESLANTLSSLEPPPLETRSPHQHAAAIVCRCHHIHWQFPVAVACGLCLRSTTRDAINPLSVQLQFQPPQMMIVISQNRFLLIRAFLLFTFASTILDRIHERVTCIHLNDARYVSTFRFPPFLSPRRVTIVTKFFCHWHGAAIEF